MTNSCLLESKNSGFLDRKYDNVILTILSNYGRIKEKIGGIINEKNHKK